MSGFTINTVTVSGNLTRDPEARTTPGGTELCKLRIAVNDRVKNKTTGDWEDRANYFSVTIFGGLGTWVANNLKQGDGLVVSGRLSWHSWETDGNKREAVEIIADSIQPRGSGGAGGSSSSRSDDSDIPFDTSGLPEVGAAAATPSAVDDDIPF